MTVLIEVRVSSLSGEALGWAVGKAEGLDVYLEPPGYNGVPCRVFARYRGQAIEHAKRFNPWDDWAVGGPLIDKHKGSAQHIPGLPQDIRCAGGPAGSGWCYGPTALVAFCRGHVRYKLGDTVQVPKELMS